MIFYILKHPLMQGIKIGITRNSKTRLITYNVCCPKKEFYYYHIIELENPNFIEDLISKQFNSYRINGEWYDLDPEIIINYIKSIDYIPNYIDYKNDKKYKKKKRKQDLIKEKRIIDKKILIEKKEMILKKYLDKIKDDDSLINELYKKIYKL